MIRVRLRDGATLRARVEGRGPPLLLVHGFTGSAEAWGCAGAELARERRVIAPDLLGHGSSDKPLEPERYALERAVDDLCRLLDAVEVERAPWVGYSMGGRIALGAAVLRPGRVAALVLESASPGLDLPAERAARRADDEALAARLERDGIERFVDAWMRQPLFATQAARLGPARLARERERRLGNDAGALAACLRGCGAGAQPSLWPELARVEPPVLVVAGSDDVKFRALADAMADAMPRARRATVPHAGHATHLERPREFAAGVLEFTRGLGTDERMPSGGRGADDRSTAPRRPRRRRE